jgi:hypothetical protein
MKVSERKEPVFNFLKKKKKLVQIVFRPHNTMMYLLYDDGTMYSGDPDKNVEFKELPGAI